MTLECGGDDGGAFCCDGAIPLLLRMPHNWILLALIRNSSVCYCCHATFFVGQEQSYFLFPNNRITIDIENPVDDLIFKDFGKV